ncbi:alpha/beta hydrolase, partial [Candidatus Entotheonella palauensis]
PARLSCYIWRPGKWERAHAYREGERMLVDLVEVTTTDGLTLGGAYMAAADADRLSPIDCLCFFHGDGGHFYRRLYLELGARLAARGVAFLAANRRGHDWVSRGARGGGLQGYAHESVEAARLDYAAWLALLHERGHKAIAMSGHSGGAVRAVYAQAKEHFAGVNAVVSVSPGEYHHQGIIDMCGEAFENLYRQAQAFVDEGQPEAYLKVDMPFRAMWTAQAFVDSFHPDNRYSLTSHAAETGCPTLFVFGAEECAGPQVEPTAGLAMRQLRAADFAHVTVDVIEGANHAYAGREVALFESIWGWLAAL